MVWDFIRRRSNARKLNNRRTRKRLPSLETLDRRLLLVSNIGAIAGTSTSAVTSNPISGVQVELFLDDGDGVSNGADTSVGTTTTDANGDYRFDSLATGTYHVVQAQAAGHATPSPVTVQVTNENGVRSALIDDFSQTTQSVTADSANPTVADSVAAPEAIGGFRDVQSENTNSQGQITAFSDANTDQLNLGSLGSATGTVLVQYDGNDGSITRDPTGLAGATLTGNTAGTALIANSGVVVMSRAQNAGDTVTITIHSNATDSSTASFSIPVNAGPGFTETFIPFANFSTASGAGADFNSIGSIEALSTLSANNDVFVEVVEAIRPDVVTADISNTANVDLTIDKTVNTAQSNLIPGGTVVFDIVVTNNGPQDATGVTVSDTLPAGLTFDSSSSNFGTFTETVNGQNVSVDVGNLAASATASFTVGATIGTGVTGSLTNTASVSGNEPETDTTNNDDDAVVTVTQADITVTKSVDQAAAQAGDTLVYTVTVTNNGPATATSVTATDTLPSGVTFVSGSGPNGALTETGGVVTVNGGTLASGASFSFTINATINAGVSATQTNNVTVATATSETNTTNNSASASTTVDPLDASIAGTVYVDADADGVQDVGEVGIAGVIITLTGTDSLGNSVSRTATTDVNGDYLFANLAAGTYSVAETQPAGFSDGQEAAGTGATSSTTGDDIFTNLGLAASAQAVDFDFGELAEFSKRRFLASS